MYPLAVLATHSILSIMASNFIWLLAVTYYAYVTFLGYTGTCYFQSCGLFGILHLSRPPPPHSLPLCLTYLPPPFTHMMQYCPLCITL